MKECINRLKNCFKDEHINYQMFEHPAAYTTQEVAGSQGIPGAKMAKCVIVKAGGKYIMCVLPASCIVNFEKLKLIAGVLDPQLASEEELANLFPDCEIGAEPPFGNWYQLPVYVDKTLASNNEIWFNAGTHTDTVKINFNDYERLAKPRLADFSVHI